MRSRSRPCRGRGSRPCAADRHATSARRPRPQAPSSSMGASVATIPGAPWHHCVRIWPSPFSSSRIPAIGGQLTSPSSSTASRSERLRDAGDDRRARARTLRTRAPGRDSDGASRTGAASTGRPRRAGRAATRCSPSRRARARGPRGSCRDSPTSARTARRARSPRSAPTAARGWPATARARCSTSRIPVSPIQRLRSGSSSGKSGGASSERSRYGT